MKLWRFGFVKDSSELIYSLKTEGKVLNLAEKIEHMWTELKDVIATGNQICIIFGEDAGFTDSRMLYTWAKSHELFNQIPLYTILETAQITEYLNNLDSEATQTALLDNIINYGGNELPYARHPRIGVK